jgi:predicted DsbA family dithiol-disulfide isomerase
MAAATTPIRVEVWSDVVCPWCYIGKRRFERALRELDGEFEIDVSYRPYQLDPTASLGKAEPVFNAYAKKFGGEDQAHKIIERVTSAAAEDGIEFRLDRALRSNTLLAHRLIWFADQADSPVSQETIKERLLQAYFIDGLNIGDPEVLAECAAEVGFDREQVAEFLDSERGQAEVRDQISQAAEIGVTAVPTYVVDGRWAIPGAQDTETFVRVLRQLNDQLASEQQMSEPQTSSDA